MKVTIEGLLSELPEDTEIVKDHAGTEGNGHSELSVTPEELSEFAQANNTDMKCVIAAAFGYSVSRFTGSTHSLINCCREGRTYPLVTDCSNRSISDFIRSSAENYAASFDHNGAFQKVSDITLSFDSKIDSGIFFKIEIGDSITVDHFNTSDYSAPTVSSLASVFDKVLSGMISCDSLSDIIYTTDDDISAIEEINNTSRPLTHSDTLSSFLATASSHPDSVMLRYLDRTYTFADCDRISDSIASALVSSGIAPGDNVAIMVPRSEWYLLCILGVMKTGAAYVPIEIAYPDERVSFMMSDALVKAILITEETVQRAASLCDAKLIDCTKIPESKFKPVSVLPSDTVTILYTSGTTGKPKGTKVTHIGLENFSEWMVSFHGLTEKDTIGLYASIGFDAHMITFFPPMVCGCSADIIPNDILLDVGGIADFLKKRNISIILFTTPLAKILLPRWDGNGCRFLIGGEKVGPVNFVDFPICNCYGPTENTIVTTAGMLEPGCTIECIGRLLPNVKGYILDREKRRLPKGAIGELYASGYQLSSGYLNRPDKNRESFIENPFSDEEGFERMYATGDYVRFMDDGRIEFIGRKDSQLKIRGNRVELMEVEACIRMMPEVKDVVVRAVPGFNGEKELCAYIVSPEQVSADALRSFVSERKPSYMVPSFVIQLDSIPLTVNCKVDTSALPIPDVSSMRAPYAAPRNDMEKKLCDSFSSVLGVQEVGIDDDFILLGGDSLKAISVQNEVGGIAAAVTILRYRTPREICSSSAQAAPVIRNDPEKGSILSAQQLFVYNAILNGKDPVAFTVTVYVPVPPGVSGDDAFNAVSKVVDAHPVLSCTVRDSRLVPGERPSVIKCKTAPAKPSFDCNGRLCEFYIVDGKTVIGQLSHLIIDAVSLDILRRDIYDALHGNSRRSMTDICMRCLRWRTWILP